ncbi:ABC transporter permease protein [Gottschalkia acidurici 9a]|uniref:ABC transporter permease protein n=1 Tax=Gottschalkia acidurici (strain ATCC 7906 / DSM 604 / BCRC 14475 / CIP 104303 / KCTC 5404 / NCIMB 10678 / 9a) TaxID=1128398 RepID=K0AU55_GOTA9|nr:ABC transporter permease [Gottschalkia acidurici]AFS77368.1 ABC transporter permease protein [Gottschalkia acidurici 9a]
MIASQIIIVIFSILFVSYSTSIFIKSRGKEFGLLSLFGMTKSQIRKYVLIENTIISILSLVTGLVTGVIFLKLFLMIMEVFLDAEMLFNVSLKAVGITSLIFLALFEIISAIMTFQIKGKEISQQLKSDKVPKVVPEFSKTKAILGIALIVVGYIVAWNAYDVVVIIAMLPVIFIVSIGTYFTFTQLSIAVANKILKSKKVLYNKINIVAFSQMIFKLQDTAKVLFLASILGAITVTATETMYSLLQEATMMTEEVGNQDITLFREKENVRDKQSIVMIEEILKKHKVSIMESREVEGIIAKNETAQEIKGNNSRETIENFLLISNSKYNELAKSLGKEQIKVNENEVVYNYPYKYLSGVELNEKNKIFKNNKLKINLNGESKEFNLDKEIYENLSRLSMKGYSHILVMNDSEFNDISQKTKDENKVLYNEIKLDNWRQSYNASKEIGEVLGEKYQDNYYSKSIVYRMIRNSFGMSLFIGFFIAFLFLIAAGSIIYFKLFNELKQDSMEYNILRKIGTTRSEINRIITKQIAVIFFLPFLVSTSHSLFALKSLSNLMGRNLFTNGILVAIGYLVFQIGYFFIIRGMYIKRIKCME